MNLPDVQKQEPEHKIAIQKVGISGLILPVFITQKVGGHQYTTAKMDCYVSLAADLKGTNMSRIPRTIHQFLDVPLTAATINNMCYEIKKNAEADDCELSFCFPYFVKKYAPVSNEPGLVHYSVTFKGIKNYESFKFILGVEALTTNLCPCSKEISDSGAHNQRAHIKLECEQNSKGWIWLEDLIEVAEASTSCPIYSVLKREDEKYVTEVAYQNPMFVEDIARSCYDKLINIDGIVSFKIDITAKESIHTHDARAIIEYNRV
jgi:GTP cyclohydrolase I